MRANGTGSGGLDGLNEPIGPITTMAPHSLSLVNRRPIRRLTQHLKPLPSATSKLWFCLLLMGLILISSALELTEAKTHHSKRQTANDVTSSNQQMAVATAAAATAAAANQQSQSSGRDQTNWWNLWWQQYINEAEQPTVRPLVAVSYNGQTIRFPQDDQQQQQLLMQQAANLVVPEEDMQRASVSVRIRDKQRAARQLEGNHNEQDLLRQHQRNNWKSVKPTMIRVRDTAQVRIQQVPRERQEAEERPQMNQAHLVASSPPDAEQVAQAQRSFDQFGIQMRTKLASSNSDQASRQQALSTARMRQEQQQQQQVDDLMNSLFIEQQHQQQQHQMSDYEAELDGATLNGQAPGGGSADSEDSQTDDGRQVIDSSSSNMMMPERPRSSTSVATSSPAQTSGGIRTTPRPSPMTTVSNLMATSATTTTIRPDGDRQSSATIGGQRDQTTTTTTATTLNGARQPTLSGTSQTAAATTTTQTAAPTTTTTTATTTTTTTTTTTEPTQTTSSRALTSSTVGKDGDQDGLGMNETPISFEQPLPPGGATSATSPIMTTRSQAQQSLNTLGQTTTSSTTMSLPAQTFASTTPSGRIELQNGRPATSGMMLIARPKLFGTTTSTTQTVPSTSGRDFSSQTGDEMATKQQKMRQTASGSSASSQSTTIAMGETNSIAPTTSTKSPLSSNSANVLTETTTTKTTNLQQNGANNGTEVENLNEPTDDSDDDDDEPDDSSAGGAMMNVPTGGNVTASDSSDDDEGDEEDEQETATEPPAPSSNGTTPTPTKQVATKTISAGQSDGTVATSTRQPMLALVDLERLPKTTLATSRPTTTTTTTTTTSATSRQSEQPETGGQDDTLAPLKGNTDRPATRPTMMTSGTSGETPVAPSAETGSDGGRSQVLTALSTEAPSRGTLESETGITMPMDPMMRMLMVMMNQQQQQQQSSTSQANTQSTLTSPIGTPTTKRPNETSPTTNTARPTSNAVDETSSESPPAAMTTTSGARKKLQPPPTTRMPSSTTSQQQQQQVGSVAPETSRMELERMQQAMQKMRQQQTEFDQNQPNRPNFMGTITNLDDESGGREPKIELLNMDLVPIQRLMTQENANRKQQQQQLETSSTRATIDLGTTQQPGTVEVEPGMRLRPIGSSTMGTTKQSPQRMQQKPTSVSSRPASPSMMVNAPNQANTVYMIMMPQQPTATSQNLTTVSTGAAGMQKTSQTTSQTPSMRQMLTMFQEQQQQQQQQQRSKATTSAPTDTTISRATSPRLSSERLVEFSSASGASQPTTATATTQAMQPAQAMTTRKSTSGQQLIQTNGRVEMESSTTSRPRFVSQDEFREVTRQQFTSELTTTKRPGLFVQETIATTTTTTTTQTSDSSTENPTSDRPADERQQSTATKSTPTATATNGSIVTTTTTMTPSDERGETSSRRPPPELATRPPAISETGEQLQRLTQQQQQQKQAKGKTFLGAGQKGSFIPPKLRTDFNSQRVSLQQKAQQANEIANTRNKALDITSLQAGNSSSMSSALRQFGGANRMSVMKNAPVAFGRPATMMMATTAPADSLKTAGSARLLANFDANRQQQPPERPRFEYGPAIAVRRPDEPLADGQMPNCTLTGKNFCVITKDYPMNEVRQAVERSFRSVRLMYEELQTVSDQDLNNTNSLEASGAENNTQLLTSGHGKFACQTKVEMLRPGWARDEISKEWLVVVNTDVFPQRVRTESCAQPMAPCEFVDPFYDSHCQQRYSLHRFIAVDPQQPSRVTTVLMRFKAGCNCFLKRKL